MRKFLVFFLFLFFITGCDRADTDFFKNLFSPKKSTPTDQPQKITPPEQILNIQQAFEKVAEVALPAVVNIYTNQRVKVRPFYPMPFDDSPLFRDFFEEFFNDLLPKEREYKSTSLGSGFIISQDGYIVTNDHVIRNADEINVKLHDKRTFKAKVVGRDAKTDVAVIKINADNLPYLKFGDSGKIKIGQWAIAVGNPFGLNGTLTVGVISATGRSNLGIETYEDFIQTDASINPGNSGGPLLNIYGEVIGINTAIVATGQGIGFAIPANMAKNIIEQIIKKGTIERSWLGVGIQKLTPELAESMGIKKVEGILVNRVYENSPAEKAGIKEGDVILECDGKKLEDPSDLQKIVIGVPVGTTLKLKILRDNKILSIDIKTDKMPSDEKIEKSEITKNILGIKVRDLLPKEKKDAFYKFGVVVVEVMPNSPADVAGIMEGDIIFTINQKQIKNTNDFKQVVSNLKRGSIINIFLQRDNRTFYIAVKL
ncbi:MAG: DegQ family serine endoprotease [Proteobacteria bacterium]|nr:DegQ family serine endoprotease [Pseudomonadota bacterium]